MVLTDMWIITLRLHSGCETRTSTSSKCDDDCPTTGLRKPTPYRDRALIMHVPCTNHGLPYGAHGRRRTVAVRWYYSINHAVKRRTTKYNACLSDCSPILRSHDKISTKLSWPEQVKSNTAGHSRHFTDGKRDHC